MNAESPVNSKDTISLTTENECLLAQLPAVDTTKPDDWLDILQAFKLRLNNDGRTWSAGTPIHLAVQDRLLDGRQLQTLANICQEVGLRLQCVRTRRRQTAVVAATAGYGVQQETELQPLVSEEKLPVTGDPLYLKTTVRSGVTVRHHGSVILQGDINPAGEVIADGDILVWGTLRGVAHAGANGDRNCTIAALRLMPTQLRIAEKVVRVPETSDDYLEPEVAYITNEGIRISPASNFAKAQRRSRQR